MGFLASFDESQQAANKPRKHSHSIYDFLGVEIARVRTDGISSPELEGAQGLVGFPVQGLVGFCGRLRDWWIFLFRDW